MMNQLAQANQIYIARTTATRILQSRIPPFSRTSQARLAKMRPTILRMLMNLEL